MIALLFALAIFAHDVSVPPLQQPLDVDSGLRCGSLFMVLGRLPDQTAEDKQSADETARTLATMMVPRALAQGMSNDDINNRVRQLIDERWARLDSTPAGQATQSLRLEWDMERLACLSRAAVTN